MKHAKTLSLVVAAAIMLLVLGFRYFSDAKRGNNRVVQKIFSNQNHFFPDAQHISKNSSLKIKDNFKLNPVPGKPFLLVAWFALDEMPGENKRLVLLSKVSADNAQPAGYGLGVMKRGGEVRPVVYWSSGSSRGGWYAYEPIPIKRGVWFMLALLQDNDRYLSLYGSTIYPNTPPKVSFLGTHYVNSLQISSSSSDFIVGSFPGNFVQGRVGDIAILTPLDFRPSQIKSILKDSVKNCDDFLDILKDSGEVQLMIKDGKEDLSSGKLPIISGSMK